MLTLCVCISLYLSLSLAFQDRPFRQDVAVHEISRTLPVRQENGGRGPTRQEIQREVRLPSGIDHERVHRTEEAMRHHESGREPGLQGLWDRDPQRISIKVGGSV